MTVKEIKFKPVGGIKDEEILGNMTKFQNIFSRYIKPGSWAIDIGSDSGSSSFPMYLCGAKKVICFEPSLGRFELLKENIDRNNLQDSFDAFNYAADDNNSKKKFFNTLSMDNGGFIKGFEEERNHGFFENVECVNLNNFLFCEYGRENLRKVSFIKIDAEGHDYRILENLAQFAKEFKPVIMVEWWHKEILNDKIFDAIEKIGYISYRSDNFLPVGRGDFNTKSNDLIILPDIKDKDLLCGGRGPSVN